MQGVEVQTLDLSTPLGKFIRLYAMSGSLNLRLVNISG